MIKLSNLLNEIEVGLPPEGKIRSKDLFIQKNGGNLKAFKFNSINDIDSELEKIYDDYNFNYDNYISNSDYIKTINQYGSPEEVFEDIYGINPLLLKDFFKTNTLNEIEVRMGGRSILWGRDNNGRFTDLIKLNGFKTSQEALDEINELLNSEDDPYYIDESDIPDNPLYCYLAGDGGVYAYKRASFVNNLSEFGVSYNTEEGWGVTQWSKDPPL